MQPRYWHTRSSKRHELMVMMSGLSKAMTIINIQRWRPLAVRSGAGMRVGVHARPRSRYRGKWKGDY